jgi:hypothetical protein
LSWATTAIIGAGTAFITAPSGPYAIAASGAAISVASKAAEAGLFEAIDANLNVWGIVWVEDAKCGVANYGGANLEQAGDSDEYSSRRRGDQADNETVTACPHNAAGIEGGLSCSCGAQQTENGTVWGSDVYTSDSSICKAARHAGVISAQSGLVRLRIQAGRPSYAASTRNGVTTSSWNAWDKSFSFD